MNDGTTTCFVLIRTYISKNTIESISFLASTIWSRDDKKNENSTWDQNVKIEKFPLYVIVATHTVPRYRVLVVLWSIRNFYQRGSGLINYIGMKGT